MNTLYIDNNIWGQLIENFALAKGAHIRNLVVIEKESPITGAPQPVFIHNPEEYVYGFWRTLEYIDAKFGPEKPLIPNSTPHERAKVLAFCQYHLEIDVINTIAKLKTGRHTAAEAQKLRDTITSLVHNLGYRSFVYENKLTLIDVFLATFYEHLRIVYPHGMPPVFTRYKEFVNEQLTLRQSAPELFWDLPCDDDGGTDFRPEQDVAEGAMV
jgi:hypothetical protein